MKKFTKLFAWCFPMVFLFFVSVSPVGAIFMQSGDTVVVPEGKKIDEAAFISGSSLTIDSDINGDLYCAGQNIVINGNIKGDIACVGQSIKVNGIVDGNIRVAAQSIEVAGQVTRNLTVISQQLTLGAKSKIKGDIFFGAQSIQLGGSMGRDLVGAGETINISGSLLRNATVTGSQISIGDTGKIGGNLDYYVEKTSVASIESKNIKGNTVRHEIETPQKPEIEKDMKKVGGIAMIFSAIFGIVSFGLLGLVLIYFDRKNFEKRISSIQTRPLIMGLIGFAVLVASPIAFIILMATMVGLPLAFVAGLIYLVALTTASLYASVLYGKLALEKVFKKTNSSIYAQLIVGVILVGVIVCIPVVGPMIAFISFCLGLGAFFSSLLPEKK